MIGSVRLFFIVFIYISFFYVSYFIPKQNLAHRTLIRLLKYDPEVDCENELPANVPHVAMAYLKHMWKEGKKVSVCFLEIG